MKNYRLALFSALLIYTFVWQLLLPPIGAAQTSPQTTRTREPFGSSLKRPSAERPASSSVEAKQQRLEDESGLPQPEETIKVDTLLVSMDVVVTDEKESRFITGLKPEDFLIVEDNVPQQLATLTLGDDAERLPRSIVLVFDWSGSQLPYLEASIKAAKTLVDQLTKTDQMAIVTDSIFLLVDFTNDKKRLKSSLDALLKQTKNGWHGKSQQFSALLATLRELIDVKTRRPIIIFQTDGDEFIKLKDPPGTRSASSDTYYMSDIYAEVERSRVKIYTVIPGEKLYGIPENELMPRYRRVMDRSIDSWFEFNKRAERPTKVQDMPDNIVYMIMSRFASNQEAAARVAELSGGWTEFLDTPERAAAIYGRILADINNHYIIGYYPTNKERDGQLRRVRVHVRNHPEYKVHGRESYYAAPR
ncbi:MAG TPA: VWA domain-containing protein [Pyrinomonadaceae bacterium]